MSDSVPAPAETPAAPAATPASAAPATPATPEPSSVAPATESAPSGQPPVPAASDAPAAPKAEGIEIKLPPGADKWDAKVLEQFKSIMADPKMTPSQRAQALVDMRHAEIVSLTQQVEKSRAADLEALKGDPEFGGAKFDRTVESARSALQQFGGEEVSKLFQAYGIDKNPGVTKMLARIRAAIAEDSTSARVPKAPPDAPPQQPLTLQQRIARRYDKKQART